MSCLFVALSHYHPGINAAQMRQKIVDCLESNPTLSIGSVSDIVQITEKVPLNVYVSRMRNQSTWGGAIEIAAYVALFNRNVNVRVVSTGKIIQFVKENSSTASAAPEDITAIYWTGGHYEPDRAR